MGTLESWDRLYQEALESVPDMLARGRGVAVGFHTVVDGLHQARPGELDPLLAGNPDLAEAASSGTLSPPDELRSPSDVVAALSWSLAHSTALERVITDPATFRWLSATLPVDRPTVGGNSGNMALALADLGLPRVLVFAPPLHPLLVRLLAQAPRIQVLVDGQGSVPVTRAPVPAEDGALHWIFEYPSGLEVHLPSGTLSAARANRFIAAWNPGNHRLAEGTAWLEALAPVAGEFSHLVLSGFQLLSERYPDGTRFETWAQPLVDALGRVRRAAPRIRVHYEWASIASPEIRTYLLRHLLPKVDSLGLNEAEMAVMARDLGHPEWAASMGPRQVLETLRLLHEETGLRRIQLHVPGLYLTTSRSAVHTAQERLALAYTALAAAARSARGRATPGDLPSHLATPLAPAGVEAVEGLRSLPGALGDPSGPEGLRWGSLTAVAIPTRWVERPVWTVGLGDLISAVPFSLWQPY
ncbi:ADP-dependent glucokinase/phosphofructokinase [Limnochorda pilosa]|uniref:ADP-dependent glucokinase n=1 Tax=Limnochorda pilosa TaxID=1555112 RepID=A0A0K2SPT3_LIMPI|nr:ADP-dependent glucokinase/phosphofructokinase [Limnochorda pilosa]BAS29143.1 hypothetical protein LIP_3330 [Limnochorda pilosa]